MEVGDKVKIMGAGQTYELTGVIKEIHKSSSCSCQSYAIVELDCGGYVSIYLNELQRI